MQQDKKRTKGVSVMRSLGAALLLMLPAMVFMRWRWATRPDVLMSMARNMTSCPCDAVRRISGAACGFNALRPLADDRLEHVPLRMHQFDGEVLHHRVFEHFHVGVLDAAIVGILKCNVVLWSLAGFEKVLWKQLCDRRGPCGGACRRGGGGRG